MCYKWGHVCLHVYMSVCKWWEWWITWLLCPYLHSFIRHKSFYLYCNLSAFVWKFSHSLCLWSFQPVLSHIIIFFFPSSHFMSACIFLCRCFDRQGYCSRGWCLDTGWHCTAPWAHAQIREDIRNPSLHVSFNHTGWRGNVFMDQIVERIRCVFECVS